jgi:hypothetical protein
VAVVTDQRRELRRRRGTPRRHGRAAGATRGAVERHHGGALWPEPEAETARRRVLAPAVVRVTFRVASRQRPVVVTAIGKPEVGP